MKTFKINDLVIWNSKENEYKSKPYKIIEINKKSIIIRKDFETELSGLDAVFDTVIEDFLVKNFEELTPYHKPIFMRDAVISPCKKHRFMLNRVWDNDKPMCMFIMLNPSVADAQIDDPTIRRCIGFARNNNFGGIYVGNLFSYIDPNPKNLNSSNISEYYELNHIWLKKMEVRSHVVIAAWGNAPVIEKIKKENANILLLPTREHQLDISKIKCLEIAKTGFPKHPLYLKSDLTLKPYRQIWI